MQQAHGVGVAVYNSAPEAMFRPLIRATSRKLMAKTFVQKVDEIRLELSISSDVPLAEVVKQAHTELGLTPSGNLHQQVSTIFATLGLSDYPADIAPKEEIMPVVQATIVGADTLGLPSAPVSQMDVEVKIVSTTPPVAPSTPPPETPIVIAASGRRTEIVRASDMGSGPFWDRPQYLWSDEDKEWAVAFFKREGAYFLKVCNDDKPTKADVAQYTISASQPMRVFLDFWGGDKHAKMGFAQWKQDGWHKSSMRGTSFHQDSTTWGPGVVYERDFKAGTIVLKGNEGANGHGTYYAFLQPDPPNFDPDRKPPPPAKKAAAKKPAAKKSAAKKPPPKFTAAGNNGLWTLVNNSTAWGENEEKAAAAISAARQANPNYRKPDKKDECGGLCGIICLSGCYIIFLPLLIQVKNGLNFYVRYLPFYGGCVYGWLMIIGAVPHPLIGFNTDSMLPAFTYLLAIMAFTWTAYIMMYNREIPLHNAAQAGRSKVITALLGKGADVNGRTHFKTTALHVAAANGYDGTVKVLIDKGADINAKHGCCDCTPIECACACCAPHVVCRLWRKGAKCVRPFFCLFLIAVIAALPLIAVFHDCRKVNFAQARIDAQDPTLWPEENPVPAESLCERLGLATNMSAGA